MPPTYFYTRFGIGVSDPQWIEYRIRLFQAVTLPSVARHLSQNTQWLIFVDERMNTTAKKTLEQITTGHNIKVIPIVVFPQASRRLSSEMPSSGNVRLVRIDDDDAISDDFMRHIPSRVGLHTLPQGYEAELAYRLIRVSKRPFLSLNTIYHGPAKLIPEFARVGHHATERWALARGFSINIVPTTNAMYIYSRHKQSDSNFYKIHNSIRNDTATVSLNPSTRRHFGFNEVLFEEWREFSRTAPTKPSGSVWKKSSALNEEASRLVRRLYEINAEIRKLTADIFNEDN